MNNLKSFSCRTLLSTVVVLFAITFGISSSGYSQPFWGDGIQTPNAASLTAATELSLNKHAGSPNFTIPLYEVKVGDLSLPINLRYISDGLQVDNIPTWVGLGWTLQAGGAITRSMRGLPDERFEGYINTGDRLYEAWFMPSTTVDKTNYYHAYRAGEVDPEPDIFHINVGNLTGKFVFGPNGDAVELGGKNLKIEYEITSGNFSKWIITDVDGTKYTFEEYETIESGASWSSITTYRSAWFVTEIESPGGGNIILEYTDDNPYIHFERRTYCERVSHPEIWDGKTIENKVFDSKMLRYLSKIITEKETIEFSTSIREDIPDFEDVNRLHRLDSLTIKRGGNDFKSFSFDYDYRIGTTNGAKRLILKKVTERGNPSSVALPSYEFDYIPGVFPERLSKSTDHWGYYRGGSTTASSGCDWVTGEAPSGVPTRDRTPDNFLLTSIGLLKEIKYPTGGLKTIEYEPNSATTRVGGARIEKIVSEDGMGSQVTRRFEYGFGYLVTNPIYHSSHDDYTFYTTGPFQEIGYSGGSHVSYSSVDEIIESGGGSGKIRHIYTTAVTEPDEVSYPHLLGKVTSNAHRRGNLLRNGIYNGNSGLIQQKIYDYKYDHIVYSYSSDSDTVNFERIKAMAFRLTGATDEDKAILAFYGFYGHKIRWKKRIQTANSRYGTSTMTQTKNFTYDDSLRQLRSIEEVNSDGVSRTTRYKYAHEVSSDGTQQGIDYRPMGSPEVNMITQPYSVTVTDSLGTVLKKEWTTWRYDAVNDRWLRDGEWIWTGGDPSIPVFETNN